MDLSPTMTASWTFSAEHSALREQSEQATLVSAGNPRTDNRGPGSISSGAPQPTVALPTVQWLTNTGIVGQADLAWRNSLFLTAGLRLERSDAYLSATNYSALPMLGVASVHDWDGGTLKLRVAYGKGIRAPRTANRVTVQGGLRALSSLTDLAPEEQTGVEAGFDLYVGDALGLHVTRFDQLASGLIQQVVVANSGSGSSGSSGRIALQYQNVGAIANRGWEISGSARSGALSFTSAVSFVDSHVQRLAAGYSGDLRRDDRILGVPAATVSASLGYTRSGWSATIGASRATDWIEYDRVGLAKAYANFDRRTVPLIGAELRGYWRDYGGNTHLRASFSRAIGSRVAFLLGGENLLDVQRGEPDNVTILPGRTITTGFRASFY
jgi:iron complex outermembrane receptor protein